MRVGRHNLNRFIAVALLFSPFLRAEEGGGVGQGIAANIDAAAPIAIAGIQAGADVANTANNNALAKDLAQIQNQTTKEQIAAEASNSLLQSMVGRDVALSNNDTQTKNLGMNLAMQDKVQRASFEQQHNRTMIELELARMQLRLADKQRQDAIALERAQLSNRLLTAGLVSFRTVDSSSNFGVNRRYNGFSPGMMQPLMGVVRGSTPYQRFVIRPARTMAALAMRPRFPSGFVLHRSVVSGTPARSAPAFNLGGGHHHGH